MKDHANRNARVIALALALATLAACATVAPGEDPVLVRAQQSYLTTRDACDLLFNLELANKDLIESKLPGTHAVVNQIKVRAKQVLPAMLSEIDTYKANKDKDKLSLALALLEDLLAQAQGQLVKIAAAGVPAGGK